MLLGVHCKESLLLVYSPPLPTAQRTILRIWSMLVLDIDAVAWQADPRGFCTYARKCCPPLSCPDAFSSLQVPEGSVYCSVIPIKTGTIATQDDDSFSQKKSGPSLARHCSPCRMQASHRTTVVVVVIVVVLVVVAADPYRKLLCNAAQALTLLYQQQYVR